MTTALALEACVLFNIQLREFCNALVILVLEHGKIAHTVMTVECTAVLTYLNGAS